ncbi:LOW QUALITY PROTEIN: zona pellucida protein AX 4 [Phycodurus eques]|uniref:LOW QUALITY PROTEIN: zona pellucida protein AX 4 n=1 Tax=Phycodurus eques TaxID=693459 RepID=UPI002ACE14C7|nr:LOW QUALITY PROTEIN: zona pellucida protein AX 4 [Phycodurus eques]
MAWIFDLWVVSLLSALADPVPDGVLDMECHDRSFVIAVDLSFAGDDARFEAVDGTGAYAITEPYAAKCGYTVTVSQPSGLVELRSSYFSCHTDKQDDRVFTFSFKLLVTRERDAVYTLNKTCSPSLAWSPREVSCELNYMEVLVKNQVSCAAGKKDDNWNILRHAHSSSTSDWQVMFQRDEDEIAPTSLSDARKQGYAFEVTDGRFMFRAPYGQPDSFIAMVNNIPVEVVHATLFSRQRWLVVMVDLVAACSTHQGAYEDGGHVVFKTPEAPYPGPDVTRIRVGFDGADVVTENETVQIRIPLDVKGGLRKSFASGGLYEFYTFHLDLEQMFEDDEAETRLRLRRILTTPLLPRPLFTQNRSVVEERLFQVYLGDVPEDVRLISLRLNGREAPFTNSCSFADVAQPAHGHGYLLNVSFDDPAVTQQYYEVYRTLQYSVDINYTLSVLPENELYYHSVSVTALAGPSPPVLDAVCSESGIRFNADRWAFDFLWSIGVGSVTLTPELATQRGYEMRNDSQRLQLDVPVYSQGFRYEEITLKRFLGTFEILIKERLTSAVQRSITKTCPFVTSELIMCSTDGRMTVVADLSLITPSGATPSSSNLLDVFCGPAEADDARALFSFPLNSCGSKVKLSKGNVIYRNEIFYSKNSDDSEEANERLVVQCTYPLEGLHRLFSTYRFESDDPGTGSVSSGRLTAGSGAAALRGPVATARALPTPPKTTAARTAAAPVRKRLGSNPGVHYIRVSKHGKPHPAVRKG